MTLEELKVEAKKLGYKLVKIESKSGVNPCTCGSTHTKLWIRQLKYHAYYLYECKDCGRKTYFHTDMKDLVTSWNDGETCTASQL